MRIIVKNTTNMIAYSNIPVHINKETLKYSNSEWKNGKYSIKATEAASELYEIKIFQLGIGGSADIFPPRLNILNGVKLDDEWQVGPSRAYFYTYTSNSFLINIIKNHGDLYIYGVHDN